MNTVEEIKIEVKKEFNKHFYEGERNSVYCKKHNLFATPGELKDFIDSVVDKTYTQAKLEVVEEIEKFIDTDINLIKYLPAFGWNKLNEASKMKAVSLSVTTQIKDKLSELKSSLANKKMNTVEEILATLEHERWAGWQKYLHSLCKKNEDGSLTIPTDRIERWERQIATPYEKLSEEEKESDRMEVRKTLKILQSEITQAKLEVVEELEKFIDEKDDVVYRNDYLRLRVVETKYLTDKLTELKSNLEEKK